MKIATTLTLAVALLLAKVHAHVEREHHPAARYFPAYPVTETEVDDNYEEDDENDLFITQHILQDPSLDEPAVGVIKGEAGKEILE